MALFVGVLNYLDTTSDSTRYVCKVLEELVFQFLRIFLENVNDTKTKDNGKIIITIAILIKVYFFAKHGPSHHPYTYCFEI